MAPPRIALLALFLAGALAAPAPAALAKLPGPGPVLSLAADRAGAWAALDTYELVRVDGDTGAVTRRVRLRGGNAALALGRDAVWAAGVCGRLRCRYGTLERVDRRTGRRARPLTRLGARPRGVAVAAGRVWVLATRRLLLIDPRTRRLAGAPIVVGRHARGLGRAGRFLRLVTGPRGDARRRGPRCTLVIVDPEAARVRSLRPWGCAPRLEVDVPGARWRAGVGAAGAPVFGTRVGRAVLVRTDDSGRRAARVTLGRAAAGALRLAAAPGALWVANAPMGTLTRLDPVTGRVVLRVAPGRGR